MAIILGTGAYRYEVVDNWAKLPPGQEFNADVAAVGVDAQDRVYAFNRGKHPMVVFDRDGNFLRSWGEGVFPPRARRPHGAGRHDLADRRRRPHGPPLHARRQGAADDRRPRQAEALHERRAVPPLHAHGAVAAGRSLRLRRLRQLARPQVSRRTARCSARGASRAPTRASSTSRTTSAATPTAGSTSPTARTIASRCSTATASTRRSGTTCIGRPACSWSAARQGRFYVGEIGGGMARELRHAQHRAARQHLQPQGRAAGAARRRARPGSSSVSSSRRTGSPSIRAATSTSARCRSPTGAIASRARRIPPGLRSLQKLVKVA